MRFGSSSPAGSSGGRVVSVRAACLGLLLVVALLISGLSVGCGSSTPPIEDTLGKFGAAVGGARQDQMDFEKLKADWATPDYGSGQQSQQALFALYMAGKAADQALNQPKADWIKYEKGKKGGNATVTFRITPKDGSIFSAVSLSQITVEFKKTDDTERPWRIQAVSLGT